MLETFYLGAPACWARSLPVPGFFSAPSLRYYRQREPASKPFAIDSGAFMELRTHGRYIVTPEQYADEVQEWQSILGVADFASIQDWMVEPFMLRITGKTLREHQELTVANYLRLCELAPSVKWLPVLQGWKIEDYFECLRMYRDAGVIVNDFGVGSVCKRQHSSEIHHLLGVLAQEGLGLHAFGVKQQGLQAAKEHVKTADSFAWSFIARARKIQLDGCTHKNCNHCMKWALLWRADMLAKVDDAPKPDQSCLLL